MKQKNVLLDEGEGWFLADNDEPNSKIMQESKVQIDLINFLKEKLDKKEYLIIERIKKRLN